MATEWVVYRYTSRKEIFVVEIYVLPYEIKCPRILPNLVILPSGGMIVKGSVVFSFCYRNENDVVVLQIIFFIR